MSDSDQEVTMMPEMFKVPAGDFTPSGDPHPGPATYYNEACGRCGAAWSLHTNEKGGCSGFVECQPRRAAYGVLGGRC